jgi:uncharacterized protein (DUF305 family)
MHTLTRPHRSPLAATLFVAAIALASAAATVAADAATPQQAFAAENAAAMDRMMAAMDVPPSGDVDRDFADMMIPHHQGAIEMAQAELRYGRNEQLRRIAQEIIVDQQQEIGAMDLALDRRAPASHAAPTQADPAVAPTGAHAHHPDSHE